MTVGCNINSNLNAKFDKVSKEFEEQKSDSNVKYDKINEIENNCKTEIQAIQNTVNIMSALDRTDKYWLKWLGHLNRVDVSHAPKQVLN